MPASPARSTGCGPGSHSGSQSVASAPARAPRNHSPKPSPVSCQSPRPRRNADTLQAPSAPGTRKSRSPSTVCPQCSAPYRTEDWCTGAGTWPSGKTSAEGADPAGRKRIRRAALGGAVGGAVCVAALGFSFVVRGWELGIAAWITVPLPAAAAVAAAWGGAREGRKDGIRQEAVADALAPGETPLSAYLVRSVPLHLEVPDVWDQCVPQLTTRELQLWQDTSLLLGRPWSELGVIAHGDDRAIVRGPRKGRSPNCSWKNRARRKNSSSPAPASRRAHAADRPGPCPDRGGLPCLGPGARPGVRPRASARPRGRDGRRSGARRP